MTNENAMHYVQASGLEITHMSDGWVIYRQETDRVHFLNPTAALVFELCNGRHTIAEMDAILSTAYALSAPPSDEIRTCISKLVAEGLIAPCS